MFFSGCESVVNIPLNEHSHINMKANPTGGDDAFEISYHLYEDHRREYRAMHPSSPVNIRDDIDWRDWEGDISFDGLGTAYATDGDDDEAARKISTGWELLTEDGGLLSWSNVKSLIKDGVDFDEDPKLKRIIVDDFENDEPQRRRLPDLSTIAIPPPPVGRRLGCKFTSCMLRDSRL